MLIIQWFSRAHEVDIYGGWKSYLHDVEQMILDNQLVGTHQGDILPVGSLVVDILPVGSRHVGDNLLADSLGEGSPHVVEGSVLEDTHLHHEQDAKTALCHLHGVCPSPSFRQYKITDSRETKSNASMNKVCTLGVLYDSERENQSILRNQNILHISCTVYIRKKSK